jgi:hypothetical protein
MPRKLLLKPFKIASIWAAVLAALLAVFALYTRPDFMLTLANQVWVCF